VPGLGLDREKRKPGGFKREGSGHSAILLSGPFEFRGVLR